MRKIYKEFVDANIIGVTLEHNGFKGGDAGHGGFVKITIEDMSSTAMSVNGEECKKYELLIQGDAERDTFLDAFKMIVKELEENKAF
jgi:hypothetical protein